MGDMVHILITLLGLAVGIGVLTMVLRDPTGANQVIMSGADAISGGTRSLEGR